MILYRYINRQLFMTTVMVTFVLVMVLVSGRFIKYLADAAVGDIAADVLFSVMALRFPEFLQMLLPLSLYIGLLLVLGRMYVDNEMTVLNASGLSELRVIRAVVAPVLVTTTLVALFALYVTPHGDAEVSRILEEQEDRSVLELLTPGRFHVRGSHDNHRATYAEGLDREEGVLEGIFLSDVRVFQGDEGVESVRSLTVRARRGRIIQRDGMNYLELLAGDQYQGQAGDGDFRKASFERALVRIGRDQTSPGPPAVRTAATGALFGDADPEARAELQWRFSLIAVVPLMSLAAIPLARVNPRQGRFGKLLPAILLYIFYVGLLLFMRDRVAGATDQPWEHLLWVHAALIMVIAFLYIGPVVARKRRGRR